MTTEYTDSDLGSRGLVPRPANATREIESPPLQATCDSCGAHHGSVQSEILCLRRYVKRTQSTELWQAMQRYANAVHARNANRLGVSEIDMEISALGNLRKVVSK